MIPLAMAGWLLYLGQAIASEQVPRVASERAKPAKRSRKAVKAFVKTHPCPETCRVFVVEDGKLKVWRECGRCHVDHVCPLACGGEDTPKNMQWLTAEENEAKGGDCSACSPNPAPPAKLAP